MNLLALVILLNFNTPNDLLKSTAEILVSNIQPDTKIDKQAVEDLFDDSVKVDSYDIKEKKYELGIVEYSFDLKRKGEIFQVLLWTYQGLPLKATCFVDDRLFAEIITKIESVMDSTSYELLNSEYKQIYHKDIDLCELDPDLAKIELHRIGVACSDAGMMPSLGKEMLEILKNNNIDELLNWTTSLLPEKKVYGYIGLRIVNYEPIEQVELRFSKLTSTVLYCSGCEVRILMPLSQIIGTKELERTIKEYELRLK